VRVEGQFHRVVGAKRGPAQPGPANDSLLCHFAHVERELVEPIARLGMW